MAQKVMKFRDFLADAILKGEKKSTWRLFDDKNLQEGDTVTFVNWNTGDKFTEALLTTVYEKKLGELQPEDFEGHEKFQSDEEMYATYEKYYGKKVGPYTVVKIIHFRPK